MLVVTNISVAIGLSLKEAVLASKNFTDTGDHAELQYV